MSRSSKSSPSDSLEFFLVERVDPGNGFLEPEMAARLIIVSSVDKVVLEALIVALIARG